MLLSTSNMNYNSTVGHISVHLPILSGFTFELHKGKNIIGDRRRILFMLSYICTSKNVKRPVGCCHIILYKRIYFQTTVASWGHFCMLSPEWDNSSQSNRHGQLTVANSAWPTHRGTNHCGTIQFKYLK